MATPRSRAISLARALADPVGAPHRAAQLESIAIDHMPLDQPERDIEAIRTLDLAAVRRVAERDLRPDRMIVVVRAAPAVVEKPLAIFGAPHDKIETVK